MIFTARQLEALHRENCGKVVLPYRARLTPLARDWLRQKRVSVGYGDVNRDSLEKDDAISPPTSAKAWLWWCDSPCGAAKAAVITLARESGFETRELATDPQKCVEAIKLIAADLKTDRAAGAIIFVANGALALCFANRCPSLRAVLGTTLETVDAGVRLLAANVLVIEHPGKTLPQIKTLIGRFVRGQRVVTDEIRHQLSELASCA